MKKIFALAMMTTLIAFLFVGCGHEHVWGEATCTEPQTCIECGVLGRAALGHVAETWSVVKEPTCSEEGVETGVCTICQAEVEQAVATIPHTPGEWKTIEMPTKDEEGVRVNYCTVCGAEAERESFSLTAEEIEAFYKENCESVAYGDLERFPAEYEGKYVKFTGKVIQVCSEAESNWYYSTYRVATKETEYTFFKEYMEDVVYIAVDNYDSGVRILEEDIITFYGAYEGLYTYESVSGASITIPSVIVEYFDFVEYK